MENVSLTAQEKHQLLRVLREMDAEAPAEKRKNPRRKVLHRIWIHPVVKRRSTRQRAVLLNVASGGVGLETGSPLEKGQKFILPLRFQDGGGWLVLCEVRTCVANGEIHKVGAKFLDRIDDLRGTSTIPMDWLL